MSKARDLANFSAATGVVDADIGITVASTAANTFTGLQNFAAGADIASATTLDLTAATGNTVVITGTTTTTGFTMVDGQQMILLPSGAWPITFHATTANINGGVSYTCAAGDRILAFKDLAGVIRVSVIKQDGTAVVAQANPMTTGGDLIYGGASGVQTRLANGSAAQVLTSAGGTSAPTWASPAPSANGLVWLSTVVASAVATADIETTFNSTYDEYIVIGSDITFSTGSSGRARLKIGGTYLTSGYVDHMIRPSSAASTYIGDNHPAASPSAGIDFLPFIQSSAAGDTWNFTFHIHKPSSISSKKQFHWEGLGITETALEARYNMGVGYNTGTGALTGFRVMANSGTLTGTFRLYGIANS